MLCDALVPARGASRRLPGKHWRSLGGVPLLDWTLSAACAARIFRRVCLSTDDANLLTHAEAFSLTPFPARPAELAQDGSSSLDVVRHYLECLSQQGVHAPRWVMLLQPTSPFRGPSRMREALELARHHDGEVVSLGPVEKPITWCREVKEGRSSIPKGLGSAPTMRLNGAIYLVDVERLLRDGTLLGPEPLALSMTDWESVDIDTPLDWLLAQAVAWAHFPDGPTWTEAACA
jgi:CMP-N,N'-diacetyllegionaminic acid synthase